MKKIILIVLNIILILLSLLFAEASSPNYNETRFISLIFGLVALGILFIIKINNKIIKNILIIFNILIIINTLYYCYLTFIVFPT